ncbi:hypothetical protein ACJJTC_003331 [Scirpophaga incertulas]
MDTICTACLCIGRKLYFIGETGSYNVYSQILNEIPVYDLSHVCVRVCWECRALLHRFGEFKARVKASYSLLLQHLHQNIPPSQEQLVRPSRLNISSILTIDYPLPVKLELDTDDDYLENVDPIKHESMKLEPDDDMDAAEFDLDTSEFPYADDLRKKKDENKTIQSDIEELKQDKIDNYSDMDCDNITNNKEERIEEGNRLESVLKKKEAKKKKEITPPRKKQTREERLERKRLTERLRYQRIKNDPEKYSQQKEKEKKKYERKKEKGAIKTINQMTSREQRKARKLWREKQRRRRLILQNIRIIPAILPNSDSEVSPNKNLN